MAALCYVKIACNFVANRICPSMRNDCRTQLSVSETAYFNKHKQYTVKELTTYMFFFTICYLIHLYHVNVTPILQHSVKLLYSDLESVILIQTDSPINLQSEGQIPPCLNRTGPNSDHWLIATTASLSPCVFATF